MLFPNNYTSKMNICIILLNNKVLLPYSERRLRIKKIIKNTAAGPYLMDTAAVRFIQPEGTNQVIKGLRKTNYIPLL